MSMRDFLQAEEARRAEETAQRAHDARVKELSIHPLVEAGCDRNVREAYFCGLAYAAICNDYKIDDAERDILAEIGNALALDPQFVSALVQWTIKEDDKDAALRQAFSLFAEVLNTLHCLSSAWMPRLFAAEFARIRLVHPEGESELAADFKDIGDGCGAPIVDDMNVIVSVVKGGATASMESVDSLAVLLGDEAAKYFVLRDMDLVDEPLAKFRADRAAAEAKRKEQEENRRTLPDRLAAIVESDDTWPVEFNPADYKPLFDAAGIADADIGAFVAVELLPFMKRACDAARANISKVPTVTNYERWLPDDEICTGAKFESIKEFRHLFRIAMFVDAFVDLNAIDNDFYFVGIQDRDCDYYSPNTYDRHTHVTGKRIGEERYKHLALDLYPRELFDRLQCHLSIWDDDAERYFTQWNKLFSAIEKHFLKEDSDGES